MFRLIYRLWICRTGATAIEYGLIAGIIAIGTIAALTQVGTALNSQFNSSATTIQGS
jgi:pilus assembly protein Flp/PilA